MAVLGFEGFDYQNSGSPLGLLLQTPGWTQISGGSSIITVGGLLGGRALSGGNQNTQLRYTPPAGGNYATLIVGQRWLTGNAFVAAPIVTFIDGTTVQCGLSINTSGKLFFWRGTTATVLATGTTTIVNGTWYYIEAKVTIGSGTAGKFEVRLEGVSGPPELVNNATNTQTTANAFANAVDLTWTTGPTYQRDDFYLCDNSGSVANDFLLGGSGIRVETTFVNAPSTPLQFTPLDSFLQFSAGTLANCQNVLNSVYYWRFTMPVGGTFASFIGRYTSNVTGNVNVAIYSNNPATNQPQTLITTATAVASPLGNAVIGSAPDIVWTFPSPATLVGGTQYWLAMATDVTTFAYGSNGVTGNYKQSQPYASGFPATASGLSSIPTSSSDQTMPWSKFTGTIINANEVAETSFDSDTTYNYSTVNGDVDMFQHGPLSNNPSIIWGVMVVAAYRKDDNTAQQIRTKLKSGATMSNGTTRNIITTYQASSDMYTVDPDTGLAWTGSTVNAATIGYEHL